ncbi:hypothetical protein SCLCIDRAFT_682444 [Scleroderma citrinum Foug A]|uniref:Uncharacterized protein n=1 Tax=Scleroderma citrinum Foug A TaxID=1036808 RepID=A0A0C3E6H2_9AGAM|nr:hypothetical protein SCLCIDRAFT_682444 [Scleroderma citrinum Foug A]
MLKILRLIAAGRCRPAEQPMYGTRNHRRTGPLHQSCVSYLGGLQRSRGGSFYALSRGDKAWTLLNSMTGIRRLSVWSFKPPHVLQGWAVQLGPTLRHLALGCSLDISDHTDFCLFSASSSPKSLHFGAF